MSRSRTVVTWGLLAVWVVLIAFGLVAMGDPQWLEDLATKGQSAEADAYRHLGDNELRKGNVASAIAQYVHALSIRDDDAVVHLNLCVAYLRQGDLARAEAALRRASELEITDRMRPFLSLHRGELAEAQNHPEDAIRHYEAGLAAGGRRDLFQRRLGALYLAQKDHDRAYEAFTQVLAALEDPQLPYARMLERLGEAAAEDSLAARWLEENDGRLLGEVDWQRYDRTSLEQMPSRDPEVAKTHNHLGLIAHLRGDRAGAVRHFERSNSIWPGNADATRNLRILRQVRNQN